MRGAITTSFKIFEMKRFWNSDFRSDKIRISIDCSHADALIINTIYIHLKQNSNNPDISINFSLNLINEVHFAVKFLLHIYLRFIVFSVFHDNHEGLKLYNFTTPNAISRMCSWSHFFVQALFLCLKMMILEFCENSKFFGNFWRRSKCHHEN